MASAIQVGEVVGWTQWTTGGIFSVRHPRMKQAKIAQFPEEFH
jgi:hypothetical protein